MVAKRSLTRPDVGAWVFKGNPATCHYLANLAGSGRRPGSVGTDSWTIRTTRRTAMIEPGDPMLVWMTGPDRPGVYEIGRVTARPAPSAARRAEGPARSVVPYRSVLLETRVSREQMRADPVLRTCEQLIVPVVGNPTYLTPAQVEALAGHVRQSELHSAGWA